MGKIGKIVIYDLPVHDCTQGKTVTHTMQMAVSVKKDLLESKNFATMLTWRHTFPLYSIRAFLTFFTSPHPGFIPIQYIKLNFLCAVTMGISIKNIDSPRFSDRC